MNPEENINPMMIKEERHRRGVSSFDFERIQSPIQRAVRTRSEMDAVFSSENAIPYAGNDNFSADRLLEFLNSLRRISSTLNSCWFAIRIFAIRSRLKLSYRLNPDYDLDEEEQVIDPIIKKKFYDDVLSKIEFNLSGPTELNEFRYDDLFDNGNAYLEVVIIETAGSKKALLNYHNTEDVKKIDQDEDYDLYKIGDWKSKIDSPKRAITHFPYMTVEKDGTRRCLIHTKIGKNSNYGCPIYIGALRNCYREGQDSEYLIKMADRYFTGQGILEFESDDDSETNSIDDNNNVNHLGSTLIDKIEEHFTNKGDDPKSIFVMERPYQSGPFKWESVDVNLKEGFYDSEERRNKDAIIRNLSWSDQLIGVQKGGNFNADTFMSELKIKDTGVLDFFRSKVMHGYDLAIRLIDFELTGGQYSFISLSYPSLFDDKGGMKTDEIKKRLDSVGVAVRSGTLTPSIDDEVQVRSMLGMVEMSKEVIDSWEESGKVRRPITLKGQEQIEKENEENNNNNKGGNKV